MLEPFCKLIKITQTNLRIKKKRNYVSILLWLIVLTYIYEEKKLKTKKGKERKKRKNWKKWKNGEIAREKEYKTKSMGWNQLVLMITPKHLIDYKRKS